MAKNMSRIACPHCGMILRCTYDSGGAFDQDDNEYFAGWPKRKGRQTVGPRKKRKLSAWNKFVKANSKKPRFIYRNGKLNLKKMAVAFRKTPAGKKRKR